MLCTQGVRVCGLLLGFLLLIPGSCMAQWATSGNNINNTNSGGVGIRTTTPNAPLEVNGEVLISATAGSNSGLDISSNGQGTSNVVTLKQGFNNATDNIGFLYNRANADFVFGTNNSERMRIQAGGNVGVGTTTPGQRLEVNGSIKLSAGSGGYVIFPDGTAQSTATLIGPQGPTGATGPQGPQGPPGPQFTFTFHGYCTSLVHTGDNVVLNTLGQTNTPYCGNLYQGITVSWQSEFGETSSFGGYCIYIDPNVCNSRSVSNSSKVETRYGFAVPRAGTLTNLRVAANTAGVANATVLVRKIRTDNTVDVTDQSLTCTLIHGTLSCSSSATLSMLAGERILITVAPASNETTLADLSVLVDLQ